METNIRIRLSNQQLNQSELRLHGEIYEIWLNHHQQQYQPEYLFIHKKHQLH